MNQVKPPRNVLKQMFEMEKYDSGFPRKDNKNKDTRDINNFGELQSGRVSTVLDYSCHR